LLLQNTFFFHKINAARSDSTFYPLPKNVRLLGNDVELIFSLVFWVCGGVPPSLTDIITIRGGCITY
jgi:hypothetical protein